MKPHTFFTELQNASQNFVNPDNGGYSINYKSDQKELANDEFSKIKALGFNPVMTGRKFKVIFVPYTIVRKHGLRVIEVSK